MSDDLAGGAPASADVSGAPIEIAEAGATPLGSQTPVEPKPKAPEPEKPSASAGEAIRKAVEASKQSKQEAKAEPAKEPAKPAQKAEPAETPKAEGKDAAPKGQPAASERARDEAGKFASDKAAEPQSNGHADAPHRFSPDAKAAWASAPEPIRAEVHRAIRELEQGHQKYRADSDAYNEVREFAEMAKQSGTSLKTALQNYVGIEQSLRRDPIAGLQQIVANLGLRNSNGQPATLHDIAAHILNQSPDERSSQQDATIQSLRNELAYLHQQVGGVTQTMQQQREAAVISEVNSFAEQHPRLYELEQDVTFFLNSGRIDGSLSPAARLSEAYKLAERLNPAPAAPAPAQPASQPLNPAGQKSISGAPAGGSNPPARSAAVPSNREAIRRALAQAAR